MKQIYQYAEDRGFEWISLIAILFLIGSMSIPSAAYPANMMTSGTRIKVLPGTNGVSFTDFVIKNGALMTNSGMMILKKDLINENPAPNLVGTGTLKMSGISAQSISGQNIIQNFNIANPAGVNINGNTTVNGILTLTSGKITLGNYNLFLGPSSTVSGTPSSAKMVVATSTGEFRKSFTPGFTGNFIFPVGDNTGTAEYSPVSLTFIAGSFTGGNYIGVTLRNEKYPDPIITGNYINRYWNISQTGITGISCNAVFQYVPADVVGNENSILCKRMTPPPVTTYAPANASTHQLAASGIGSFGTYTGGSQSIPSLTGPTSVCLNSTGNTYVTDPGMTNYIWSVSSGGLITAGGTTTDNTVTIKWIATGIQTVSVNYNGASAPNVLNVTVNPLPVPVINGSSSVCLNNTITYSTATGQTNYQWTVSPGGTIMAGGGPTNNSVAVKWIATGSQTVSVNYSNTYGCSAAVPAVKNVTVNPLPSPTITGPAPVCAGSTGNVYFTESGMTGYTWTISAGGTITSGAGTRAITVTWNTSGSNYVKVNYMNSSGCYATTVTTKSVYVSALPVPALNGSLIVCLNKSVTYTTTAGQTNYVWTISPGGIITAGGGSTSYSVTVKWIATGVQTISVNYTNTYGCTALNPTVKNVTVNPVPSPTITGPTPVCSGSSGNLYFTESGMTGYTWSISPGGTITAGAGTNAITVTWTTSGSKTLTVNYQNSSGCYATTATSKSVTVNASPIPVITGPATVTVNTTNQYSTTPGMTNYTWGVSPGGTVTSGGGPGDSWVNILWTVIGPQYVSVNYANSYGCSAPAPTIYNVIVNPPASSPGTDPVPVTKDLAITHGTDSTFTSSGIDDISIYPVPNDGKFTISFAGPEPGNYSIAIYNCIGTEVYNLKNITINGSYRHFIDLGSVTDGIYVVIIRSAGSEAVRRIFIKK